MATNGTTPAALSAQTAPVLRAEGVTLQYKTAEHLVTATYRVDFEVFAGERFVLLGPSGCGKTTLLRTIAGFVHPDAGSVRVGGRDIGRLPANRRNTGLVFQSYALFPHLSVADNVAYGLRVRGMRRSEREERVRRVLWLVEHHSRSAHHGR